MIVKLVGMPTFHRFMSGLTGLQWTESIYIPLILVKPGLSCEVQRTTPQHSPTLADKPGSLSAVQWTTPKHSPTSLNESGVQWTVGRVVQRSHHSANKLIVNMLISYQVDCIMKLQIEIESGQRLMTLGTSIFICLFVKTFSTYQVSELVKKPSLPKGMKVPTLYPWKLSSRNDPKMTKLEMTTGKGRGRGGRELFDNH